MKKDALWTRDFMTICLSSFFMFLNFYMLATTLPLYVKEHLQVRGEQIGLVITIYIVGTVLLRPVSGQLVDRFGKKKIAMLMLALFFLCSALYLTIDSFVVLLLLRAVHGASYGVSSTATSAHATDLVPGRRKGEGIGYFSMFMSLAMVVGPSFGLFLSTRFDYRTLLYVSAAVALLSLIFSVATRAPESDRGADTKRKTEPLRLGKIVEKSALPVSLAGMVLAFSYSSLTSFLALFTTEIHQTEAASYFFIIFAVLIVASRPFTGRLFDRGGAHLLVYGGLLLFMIGMIVLSQARSEAMILLSGAVMGLGYGSLLPSFQTLAVQSSGAGGSGKALATFFLLFDFGYGLGSYFLGIVASNGDYRGMFLMAGIVPIVSALIYYSLHHRRAGHSLSAKM